MSSKIVTLKTPWYFSKQEISLEKIDLSLMSTVEIPHTWNNIDGQDGGMDYYRGTCWYYHPFNVACKKGRQVIFFEGVNSIARVYVNQTFIGEHQGGYSAFSFD
ncbi:MAG: glycoside hydrolase family 2 protein, partial [Firmicutes bacterium]|nr:glycoside hydrolase family 2 protein [Bacillota bacterium]